MISGNNNFRYLHPYFGLRVSWCTYTITLGASINHVERFFKTLFTPTPIVKWTGILAYAIFLKKRTLRHISRRTFLQNSPKIRVRVYFLEISNWRGYFKVYTIDFYYSFLKIHDIYF